MRAVCVFMYLTAYNKNTHIFQQQQQQQQEQKAANIEQIYNV